MTQVREGSSKAMNQGLKSWFMAARPKTLTVSTVSISVGTFLAYGSGTSMEWSLFLFALISALFIQIGTNLINDAIDFKKGSDTPERLGPQRVTQSGLLPASQVLKGGFACLLLALLFGIPLMLTGGIPLVIALGISALCAYFYTGGPYPIAYNGLADCFVLIFFGFVATGSVYYLQTGALDATSWLAGAQVGLLAAAILVVANIRDIEEDRKVEKRTLQSRFGTTFGRVELSCLVLGTYLLGLLWIRLGHPVAAFLPWATFPLAVRLICNVWIHEPSRQYNVFLGMASLLLLLYGTCLCIGFSV